MILLKKQGFIKEAVAMLKGITAQARNSLCIGVVEGFQSRRVCCHNPGNSGQRDPTMHQMGVVFEVSPMIAMIKDRATDRNGEQHGQHKGA